MSLESWKKEFYPIKASEIKTIEEALDHSIKKWEGLTHENLIKHRLWKCRFRIIELNEPNKIKVTLSFSINDETCALCYLCNECFLCPLQVYLGKGCDGLRNDCWWYFVEKDDPSPMLEALKETKKNLVEIKKKIKEREKTI